MSIDLRLLPCEHWSVHDKRVWGFSHTVLTLGSVCEEAWNDFQLRVKPYLAELPVDHDITSFVGERLADGHHKGEHVYGRFADKDAYGEAYKAVAAKHLLPWIVEHFQYDGDRGHGPYQASIAAYVRTLPPDTQVVLDWH